MDRFDKNARAVFVMAQQLAEQHNDSYIGTDHLLRAMLKLDKDPAGRMLRDMGLEQRQIDTVVATLPKPERSNPNGPREMLPTAKKALATAAEEAQQLNSLFVKSEHILLGVVQLIGDLFVDQVFTAIQTTPEAIDRQIRRALLPPQPVYQPPTSETAEQPLPMPGIGLYDQMVNGLSVLFQKAKTWLRRPPPDEMTEPVKRD
jgi:ATP-dependent Clp protease ATP-binding subunit ClpA